MTSTYLLHQPGAAVIQGNNMPGLDLNRDVISDGLLGASYPDPLPLALIAQYAANAPTQLGESSDGPWDRFNFQIDLLDGASSDALQQPPQAIQPTNATFTADKILNLPEESKQASLQSANDENDKARQNLELEESLIPTASAISCGISDTTSNLSHETRGGRFYNRYASVDSESTLPSPLEPSPLSKRRYGRKAQARKHTAAKDKGEEARRTKSLARNRQAASKCRHKKKEWIYDLEEAQADLEAKNKNLHTQYKELLSAVMEIKNSLLTHSTCNDPVINEWINIEAGKYVETSLKLQEARREAEAEALKP